MKFNKLILSILSLAFLVSCGNSYVLSPEQMEDVLVDLHLAEGIAIGHSSTFKKLDDKLDLYTTVYSKHNTDKAQFDSSLVYYSENLGELTEIYEEVYNRIIEFEVQVEVGNFVPSTSILDQTVFSRVVDQDKEILPFVVHELWNKKRDFIFVKSNFTSGKAAEVTVDTLINRQLELRYTLESDSLISATCLVTMYYDDDKKEEKTFDLPVEPTRLMMHSFTVDDSPKRISVKFDAEAMNSNAALALKDLRLYDMATEAHSISLFN